MIQARGKMHFPRHRPQKFQRPRGMRVALFPANPRLPHAGKDATRTGQHILKALEKVEKKVIMIHGE